ncbi:MAG: right-handed parallel beta-helix repeat-containing protein [Planctomycetaceae bacterium]
MAAQGESTANVLIDCRESKYGTAEVAITGCTIQHNSAGQDSANIRVLGGSLPDSDGQPVREGHVTITGNVLSDVRHNVHLQECRGVTLNGNTFWMGYQHNLLVENCSHVVMGANNFDRNPRYAYGTALTTRNAVVFRDCEDCTLSGLHIVAVQEAESGLLLERCSFFNVSNCTILDCDVPCLKLVQCADCLLTGIVMRRVMQDGQKPTAVSIDCQRIAVVGPPPVEERSER